MLLFGASAALAQAPPAYPGTSSTLTNTYQGSAGDGNALNTWSISGPSVSVYSSDVDTKGWGVSRSGNVLSVSVPTNAPLGGPYTATYATTSRYITGQADYYIYSGPCAQFQVVNPPSAKPTLGNPAFSWQGSVGGVNTGNGNKTTTLPIVGWTQRGGLPVSFGLVHNSQNSLASPAGPKWQMSYFTYLTNTGGNPTLNWDSGLSYSFTKNSDGSYTPPYGIMDKLVSIGGNQFTLTTTSQIKYTFGYAPSNAYLSAITDMDGNTLTINHNPDTSLSSIVDNAGRTLTLGYSGGKLYGVIDPLGRQWTFGYTGAGDLWYVVDPAIGYTYSYRAFAYDANGHHDITQTQDHNNNQSYYGYNGDDSLAWARDAVGNQTNFAYNPGSTVMTDPNGHTLTHTYAASRLASMTDARGQTESYAYDYNNILSSRADKRSHISTFSSHFDKGNNNISTSTDALGNSTYTTYDGLNKITKSVDAIGNTTTNVYTGDTHEDLLSTTVNNYTGAATAFTATSKAGGYTSGQPTTFTDANSHSSSITYDSNGWGYAVAATDAMGITIRTSYNALGWKLTSTDALNRVTLYTYDNWGRLTVVTAPDGTQTSTLYDPNGNVLRVADADAYAAVPVYAIHCGGGAVGRFGADAYGSGGYVFGTGSAIDTSGVAAPAPAALYQSERAGTFTYTLPNLTPGRIYTLRLHFAELSRTGPGLMQFNVAVNGVSALTNYDPWAAAGAMNKASIVEYNAVANGSGQVVVSFTSGGGDVPTCSGIELLPYVHTVSNNYDGDNRTINTFTGTGNGNGDVVSYTYDGPNGRGSTDLNGHTQFGLLSSKTDGNGHTTTYTYTVRDEPYQTFYPDNTSEGRAYDANGNLTIRAKGDGKVINYTYDADNRLTDITYPTLPAVHYAYDADSRRTQMTDGNPTATNWMYGDGLHLTHLSSGRGDVLYDYWPNGQRWHMTAIGVNPSSPTSPYVYNYDADNRLKTLQNPFAETTTFSYNDDGTVRTKALANGAYTSYWYDPANGQMTDLQYIWPGLGGSYSHHYTYTPAGSLASRSEGDGGNNSFGYDGANRLISEVRTGPVPFTRIYTYDHNGNRLTQTVNGSLVQSFTYDAHDKLTGGLNESESYDTNGNLTVQTVNGQTTRFGWDDEDRLYSQTLPDGHSDTYSYTGLGMRLRKNDPSGNYWYDADGVDPASNVLSDGYSTFTPGISETHGTGSGTYASVFYLADAQGNSRGLLNGGQANTDGYNWDAFGNSVSRFGTNPTAYAWNEAAGYQSDGDSGLKLLGHRYYDSRTGRFISQDPAGDGDNWYAYADNDPMNKTDPSGLLTKQEDDQGQQDYKNNVPGLYDFYLVTNGDYANAKYLYTRSVGFNYISMLGATPSAFLNFPGGAGSSFLTRRVQYAQVEYKRARLDIQGRIKWFTSRVGAGNAWDIKKDVSRSKNPSLWFERDSAGNFAYGALGTATGFHTQAVLFGGGYAQWKDDGPIDSLSHALTHGDDCIGQADIAAGIDWYKMGQPVFSLSLPLPTQ